MLGLLLLLALAQPAYSRNHVTFDKSGNVEKFYGVPLQITKDKIKNLPFTITVSYRMGEDGKTPIYCLENRSGIKIRLEFEANRLYLLETNSAGAVGPRGIHVGSSLREVKKAWPDGKLLYGQEEGGFITYVSGTNVLYLFDPSLLKSFNPRGLDLNGEDASLKVSTIRILPRANPVPWNYGDRITVTVHLIH